VPDQLSLQHRQNLRSLTNLAERDLEQLWREVDDAVRARDALMDVLPPLTGLYGTAAASLAADYYDDLRDAQRAAGAFSAIVADLVDPEALTVLARVAVGPLFGASPDMAAALVLAKGGLQRHVANTARETVRTSTVEDRAARGWVRVGSGSCDWCRQYLTGEVVSDPGYGFDAHDHCGCTAEPVFS
jgi:hypothetical protein